jgi:hypothetical protein
MLLKTLLNRVHPGKGFVYTADRMVEDSAVFNGVRVEATLRSRRACTLFWPIGTSRGSAHPGG